MNRNEISNYLFEKISDVEPYPEGVKGVDSMLDITAFFPGGKGLWLEVDTDKNPNIMVLGHDFSTVDKFKEMQAEKANDISGPTWRNMIQILAEANIELTDCFFTNVFMGLRDTKSMVGKFPGLKDKAFVDRNIEYLKFQISIIMPQMIITLGKYASELLSVTSKDLCLWSGNMALKTPDIGLIRDVKIDRHICNCVAIEHPSMRNSNVKRRKYKGLVGNEAEVTMLKDGLLSL